jgi:hypothetical protein
MKKIKRMAEGGISELSDAELGRLGSRVQGSSSRGTAKVQLEQFRRGEQFRREQGEEDEKKNVRNRERFMELENALDRGENAAMFMDDIIRHGGGMKRFKAQEYKKGGQIKRMASGGRVRGDGCAIRGKTKGKMV